jgi:hypothetical protein
MFSEEAVLKRWVAQGLDGAVLTQADRSDVVDRIRRRHEADGVPWHGYLVWAGSPAELDRRWAQRLPAPARLWERAGAVPVRLLPQHRTTQVVGPGPEADPVSGWIASRSLVVVCEPPRVVRTESVGTAGERRLHCESGPAVEWPDQLQAGYYLHGVRIPRNLFLNPTVESIHREGNSEIRRLVIERMGWLRYIEEANLSLVAAAPDPGNAGHELQLYDLPKGRYEPARLLLMVNGSLDRSGCRRQYVEVVPAWIDDPVQAAAWQYGCPVQLYRQLARRT